MNDKETLQIMAATIAQVKDLIQKRMASRIEAMNSIIPASTLDGIPDAVKLKREEESSKIRAVIQEQKDLLEIINMLFP